MPQEISAAGWVLADLDSGQIIAAKDPHGRHRPASTIKVLLALVALQHLNLKSVVTGTQADSDAEGSAVGIGPGGKYTNEQLLQGLLMNSGNDAAHALAAQLGGDAKTVDLMNDLAASLGAIDTRTATPSGLDGPGMSCSAHDLALLFREALDDPEFARLVGTRQVQFPGYPPLPDDPEHKDHPGFLLSNDNQLLWNYDGALGGKTGYTDDAQQTFVGAAERGGRRLEVTLMMGTRQPVAPWQQAAQLLDYGFSTPKGTSVGMLGSSGVTVSATFNPPLAAAPSEVPASAPNPENHWGRYAFGGACAVVFVGLILAAVRSARKR